MAVEQETSHDGFWRERAEQLQTALESRVVIEQAKGILAERIGLDLQRAFELLRGSARSDRIKLRELADTVVAGEITPRPIIRLLARYPDYLRIASREERVRRTEEFFKQVNDALADGEADRTGLFFCECGNPLCNEKLEMTAIDDLRLLHQEPGYYAILPGHQLPDLETVVLENPKYLIVKWSKEAGILSHRGHDR